MGRALVAFYQGTGDLRVLDALVKVYSDYPVPMGHLNVADVTDLCNLDAKLSDCITQYMLGDSLLVTAFADEIYLPAGRSIDYWTGSELEGPKEMAYVYPANRAGGLFIKSRSHHSLLARNRLRR